MSFHHQAKVVTDNLIFYVDAKNIKSHGDNYVIDLMSNIESSLGYVTYDPDLYFDYTQPSQIDFGFPESINQIFDQMTMCAWIKIDDPWPITIDGRSIFSKGITSVYNGLNFSVQIDRRLRIWYQGTGEINYSNSYINPGEWTYASITWKQGEQYVWYINGQFDVSTGSTKSLATTIDYTVPHKMGIYTTISEWGFAGYIPVFQYYNKALSASEVLQNYNALKSRYGL